MIHKGYSVKQGGNMYLAAGERDARNIANRKRFFEALGFGGKKIVAANLVHGTHVEVITLESSDFLLKTDALVTKEQDVVLTLTGADCFPVYFEDTKNEIIGLAHCGWRGITGNIIPKTLDVVVSLGGKKENIVMTIGPGICAEHFEVQGDVIASFAGYPEAIRQTDGKNFIDLKSVMLLQATESGITSEHIVNMGECTFCLHKKYFSYRRDKPVSLETQVAYIVR